MNRRPSRGIVGYVVLLTTLLLIAILLNGGLSQTVSRRIEYPQLLDMIKEGKVSRVAIRNNALVDVTKSTNVAADDSRNATTILKPISVRTSWTLSARLKPIKRTYRWIRLRWTSCLLTWNTVPRL